jgi:predicted ATP-binding protein involved in virulence
MKINSIALKDFKKFDDCRFRFSPHFNVLIGDNGSGKTTILEAIAIAINSYVSVIEGRNVRPIRKEDVRVVSFEHSIEAKLNTAIAVEGDYEGEALNWTIGKPYKDFGFMRMNDKDIKSLAKRNIESLSQNGGENLVLPVFNYLGSGRLWTETSEKVKIFPKGSRLEGYHYCLSSKGSFKRFVEWFKTMELSALQNKEASLVKAQTIKRVVAQCIDDWDSIFFSVEDDMLMAVRGELNNRQILPFNYLSDGQRNIIGLVADIAYRCLLLNPQLGHEAPALTPGIVLVDELDLHLHPTWQRTIVEKLKKIFPAIQFITTTHSPFIVQSLEAGELLNLDNKVTDLAPQDLSIGEVAENIMGVESDYSEANKEVEDISTNYLRLLQQSDAIKVSGDSAVVKQLDELEAKVSDPAVRAFLQMKRLEKENS